MPQLSRKKLRPDVENRVRELLATCIQRCRETGATENFIETILTDTEKLMIAKRVSIALMVLKQYKLLEITKTLNVTGNTVRSVILFCEAEIFYEAKLPDEKDVDGTVTRGQESLRQRAVSSSLDIFCYIRVQM